MPTTWNPSDKTANETLSGGNLIVTSTSVAIGGVRSIASANTGKFYWEITFNVIVDGAQAIAGVVKSTANLSATNINDPQSGSASVNGGIFVNGGFVGSITTLTAGGVMCIALDAGANLLWFRSGAAGPWNGSGTANPATGVGGGAIGAGGAALFPYVRSAATGTQTTTNFGDTAFTGTVPSGFTAGFGPSVVAGAGVRVMVMA